MIHQRKPLGLREARIIWRMKHVLKLPVTKIAVVLERNKTSAYRALGPNFKPEKGGRWCISPQNHGRSGRSFPPIYVAPPGQNPLPGG